MGLSNQITQIFNQLVDTKLQRQILYPLSGRLGAAGICVGVQATSGAANVWGIWIDIALPALIAVPQLIIAVCFDTASILEKYNIGIGSTNVLGVNYANGAAVTATAVAATIDAAQRAEVRTEIITIAGAYPVIPIAPVYLAPGHGIIARIASTSGADTLGISVITKTL